MENYPTFIPKRKFNEVLPKGKDNVPGPSQSIFGTVKSKKLHKEPKLVKIAESPDEFGLKSMMDTSDSVYMAASYETEINLLHSEESEPTLPNPAPTTSTIISDAAKEIDKEATISALLHKVEKMEHEMENIKKVCVKISSQNAKSFDILGKLAEKLIPNRAAGENIFKLPVENEEELKFLENKLQDSKDCEIFETYLREIRGQSSLNDVFPKLMSDKLIQKLKLKSYKRVFASIFNSCKRRDYGMPEYEAEIKKIIKLSHTRVHSSNYRQREKTSN